MIPILEYISDVSIYKQNYINKRNAQNAEIGKDSGLTEEQTDALEELCKIRHEIHSNQRDMWNAESGMYSELWGYLYDDNSHSINSMLRRVGLPEIVFTQDYMQECPNSLDYDEVFELEYDEAYFLCMDILEAINTDIENYLAGIDEQYATSYCPTGISRNTYSGSNPFSR